MTGSADLPCAEEKFPAKWEALPLPNCNSPLVSLWRLSLCANNGHFLCPFLWDKVKHIKDEETVCDFQAKGPSKFSQLLLCITSLDYALPVLQFADVLSAWNIRGHNQRPQNTKEHTLYARTYGWHAFKHCLLLDRVLWCRPRPALARFTVNHHEVPTRAQNETHTDQCRILQPSKHPQLNVEYRAPNVDQHSNTTRWYTVHRAEKWWVFSHIQQGLHTQ